MFCESLVPCPLGRLKSGKLVLEELGNNNNNNNNDQQTGKYLPCVRKLTQAEKKLNPWVFHEKNPILYIYVYCI